MENKGDENVKWHLSSFAPPYVKVSECFALVVLCKFLWFFSFSLLPALFPSSLSRKNIYLSMDSVTKFLFASVHVRELFSSLMCSLTVNQSVLYGTISGL